MIFLAYIGFDSIAANSLKLLIRKNDATWYFRIINHCDCFIRSCSFSISWYVPLFKISGNAEPVGWALRQSGHGVVAAVVQAISVIGMFTALIGMMLAGSRLLYSFGRDGLLPSWLAKLNDKHLPNRALVILTVIGVLIGSMFPFAFLAQLISAGTLIAFMFVSIAMYSLRKREGKDLPVPAFKVPFFPVLPVITFY